MSFVAVAAVVAQRQEIQAAAIVRFSPATYHRRRLNNTNSSWTLALAAAVVLLALAPQNAAPGRADNYGMCRAETVAAPAQEEDVDPAQRAMVDYLTRRFSIAAEP